MPEILIYHNEAQQYASHIQELGYKGILRIARTPEEAARHIEGAEVILGWNVPDSLLAAPEGQSVRWIQSTGAGIDNLANSPRVPAPVTLTRIVDQYGRVMAEYVLGYMLFHNKEMKRLLEAQQSRRWDGFRVDTLEGKIIGVAGLGSIGAEIVAKARAFHMQVYGLSRGTDKAPLVDRHFTSGEWTDFVKQLDYLVVALPLTQDTRYTVNQEVLAAMKPGACLINVGRGGLIDEKALIGQLQQRPELTAVLDVFDREPLDRDNPLWELPNVIITPHLSGPSRVPDVSRYFMANLDLYIQGLPLRGVVDRIRGY